MRGYHHYDCDCIECRRMPRDQRKRLGERLIEWWCSHANTPSWSPAEASRQSIEPARSSRRRREPASRYTGGPGCTGS